MAFEMKMPDLATTGSDVRIIQWLVEVGQTVKRGDLLVEVETDKANVEVESVASGVLRSVLVEAGQEVPAGAVIALIEDPAAAASQTPSAVPAVSPEIEPVPPKPDPAATTPPDAGRPRGGMFARNREAVQAVTEAPSAALSLSAGQRTVARRMQESKQTVPHFYLEASFNAEPISARRKAGTEALVWDALFVCAVGRVLPRFERIACRYEADRLVPSQSDAVGVAVDADGELYVLSVTSGGTPESISADIRTGVEKIRRGDPEARKLQPAALTITNLGSTKVEQFYAIVNPPEAAILAIGRIAPVPVVQNGAVAIQTRGQITLSADHRVVNGKYAAEFLSAVIDELEAF